MTATDRSRRRLLVVMLVILALVAVGVALIGGSTAKAQTAKKTVGPCAPYTTAEVAKAEQASSKVARETPNYKPIFAVPRCMAQKHLYFAFINPGFSLVSAFVDWHNGMTAAAKFYGFKFKDVDLNGQFDTILSAYNVLTTGQKPQVLGALASTAPSIAPIARKDGIAFLGFEINVPGYNYYGGGGPVRYGTIAGQNLGLIVAKRLKTIWKGQHIVYLTVTQSSDSDVRKEMAAGQKAFHVSVPNAVDVTVDNTSCSEALDTVADALTAHPNDKVAIFGCNDGAGISAYNAAKTAGRLDDVAIVSTGGGALVQQTMKADTAGAYVGAVYTNHYAEAWGYIEASVAVYLHKHYGNYVNSQFITPATLPK